MAKRAAAGGVFRRLRVRAERSEESLAPDGGPDADGLGASEDAQVRATRTWFPPAYEAAAKERERELADERARRLAAAGGQPPAPAVPEPAVMPDTAVPEPAEMPDTPVAEPATAETTTLPPATQHSGGGWLPGGEAVPRSASEQAAPSPRPPEQAAPSQSKVEQPTSPWLLAPERPDDERVVPDSPWLAAPERSIAEPTPQAAPATTIAQPLHTQPPPDATVFTSASRRAISAVEAYSRELCPSEEASAAAAEVLGSFTAGDELDLLRHTRRVVANHAVQPGSRRGRWLPRGARDQGCESTPGLLAARANGELDPAAQAALERHLDSCATCQAAEMRARRADRAFAGITRIELPREEPSAAPPLATVAAAAAASAPAVAPVAVAEAPAVAAVQMRPPPHPRPSRRSLLAVLGTAAAVTAATAVAVVLLTSGSSKHQVVAPSATPVAPVTTRAAVQPVHKARPRPPVSKKRPASKPATPTAAPRVAAAAAPAASAPAPAATPSSSSSAPAASPEPAASSAPASSSPAPAPAPSSSSSPPASSGPPVSIQQPSLGSANAPQGVGK